MTGGGRPLPKALKAQIGRELDRLELLLRQIRDVEDARDAKLAAAGHASREPALLLKLKGIGPESAAVLWSEGLSRRFDNRQAGHRLRGPGADALAERPGQPRPGCVDVGQHQTARDADPGGLAVGAASADLCARRLVQGARDAERRSAEEVDDRGAGPQAPRGALEVRQRRGRYRKSCCAGLTHGENGPTGKVLLGDSIQFGAVQSYVRPFDAGLDRWP